MGRGQGQRGGMRAGTWGKGAMGVARRALGAPAVPGARDGLFPAAPEPHSRSFFPKQSSDPARPTGGGSNPERDPLPALLPRNFASIKALRD